MPRKVEVCSIVNCMFSIRAKALLNARGTDFVDHDLTDLPTAELNRRMMALTGRRTVPQIVIEGRPIGGHQELLALHESGELDELLGISQP